MVRHHARVAHVLSVRRFSAIPAPVLFVLSGISMYAGAAIAVGLFGHVTPSGVAWLRCLGAAVVLLAWRRPKKAAWRGRALLLSATFGVVTAGMNVLFYEAIARLSGLSAAQKQKALEMLRTDDCPCGCGFKLAECRFKDPACSYSKGLAAVIVAYQFAVLFEEDAVEPGAGQQFAPGDRTASGVGLNVIVRHHKALPAGRSRPVRPTPSHHIGAV